MPCKFGVLVIYSVCLLVHTIFVVLFVCAHTMLSSYNTSICF